MTKSKQQIMDEISAITHIPQFHCSSGSTEPREFFTSLAEQLGLHESIKGLTKPEIAKFLCQSLGGSWGPHCESSGSTVTREGLEVLYDQLKFLREL
jgi:hypothetical protein